MVQELQTSLSTLAARYPEVLALYLFGSRSRGDHTEESDFDLALLVDPRTEPEAVWNLRLEIADLISRILDGRKFDLVVMGEDLDLTFRILQQGERLFTRDHDMVCYREANLASMYYDYKPFLDSYLQKVAERFRRVTVIRHCLERLATKSGLSEAEFLSDPDAQDVVLRNLQVGIQAALDIGLHVVRDEGWDLPGASTGTFDVLASRGVLGQDLADRLRRAVQMRNLLVHAYDAIDMRRVYAACQDSAGDLDRFAGAVADYFRLGSS